jgi:hypothetical protein
VKERKMTVQAEGCFIGPRALERVMKKMSLRAHIRKCQFQSGGTYVKHVLEL